ncbi:MAG: PorT family protein [Bacteroidetes bacterium]|nr:PorT family protein [Bacteroidota bacterium]
MNKFILHFLFLMTPIYLFAQKGFHLGISGTFNSTWILDQNNIGTLRNFKDPAVRVSEMAYKNTWGGNAGLVLGYNFDNHWGIQTEIQYNFTGQLYRDSFMGPVTIPEGTFGKGSGRVDVQRDIYLQYIQIPLFAKYISKGKVVKFFFALGPQIGFRTAASEEVRIAGYVYLPDSLAFTAKQKFKAMDVGAALQTGVEIYPLKFLYVNIGISTYYGFTDINGKILKNPAWYQEKVYHASHNFRAGLMVGLHYIITKNKRAFSHSSK